MSIRRISELPSIESVATEYVQDVSLSDCIFETSYTPDGGTTYKSTYMKGNSIVDNVLEDLCNDTLSNLYINGTLTIDDGNLCIIHSKVRFLSGSSVDAWNNDDPYGEDTYLCCRFDHVNVRSNNEMELSANGQNGIYGNPVVINDNLYVWTNMTQTNELVVLTNTGNTIHAQSTQTSQLGDYPDRVVTCGMLNDTIVYFTDLIYTYDKGDGVGYTRYSTPPQRTYSLTITTNNSNGTTNPPPNTYTFKQVSSVTVTAIPNGTHTFQNWTGDCTGNSKTVTINVNKQKYITANFDGNSDKQITIKDKGINQSAKITFKTDPSNATWVGLVGGSRLDQSAMAKRIKSDLTNDGDSQQYDFEFTCDGYVTLNKNYTIEKTVTSTSTPAGSWQSNGTFNSVAGAYRIQTQLQQQGKDTKIVSGGSYGPWQVFSRTKASSSTSTSYSIN